MQVKLSPQRSDKQIEYSFEGEIIIVSLNDTTDTFDFSDLPDGQAIVDEIETTLPTNPIISAKREEGVLNIELLNFIGTDATEQERFPDWQEV